jgi:photosystem II stability/assembly factor-like uncharacterized protein
LESVYFTDTNTGYIVGVDGIILKTINAGNNWSPQTSGTNERLNSVCFADANTGYAVGWNGAIIKTINGGTNWYTQTSGTTVRLNSVYFNDANTGYAVGYEGTILKTIDGGANWIAQTSGTTYWLWSVFFINANFGYAVGGLPGTETILKTIDGGTNWITQTSATTNMLYSVYFPTPDTGYAVGETGTILQSTGDSYIQENQLAETAINIFPNPAKDNLTIETIEKATVEILNIEGQILKTINVADKKTTIDLRNLSSGVYIIKARTENGVVVKKFVKE